MKAQTNPSWWVSLFFIMVFVLFLFVVGCTKEQSGKLSTTTTQQQIFQSYDNQFFHFSYSPSWNLDDHQFTRIGLVMLKQESPLRIITMQIVPKERYKSEQALLDKLMSQVKILHDVKIFPQKKGFSLSFLYQSTNYSQRYWVYPAPKYYLIFSLTSPNDLFSDTYRALSHINQSLVVVKNMTFSFLTLPLEVPRTIGLNQRKEQLEKVFEDFLTAYEPSDKLVLRSENYFVVFEKTKEGLLRDLNEEIITPADAQAHILKDVPSRPLHVMAMVQ